MKQHIYQQTTFCKSASQLHQLPSDEGLEIAFVGRSNAGKSSALNTITGIKGLARTSKTPGRTRLINVFDVSENKRLIDLPGYGYAKVSASIKAEWEKLLDDYFHQRQSLKGIILIMDIRHPLKESDLNMLSWAKHYLKPVHILLTKQDKLKRNPSMQALMKVQKFCESDENLVTVQCFSASTRTGVEEARQKLDEWLEIK